MAWHDDDKLRVHMAAEAEINDSSKIRKVEYEVARP